MPWRETCPMDERSIFIAEWLRGEVSVSELCRLFGVSRKTGYKWWNRFQEEGRAGLSDKSRAPGSHPNAVSESVIAMLVSARKEHPRWGPKKLVAWLRGRYPRLELPASSTVGAILRRHGLVRPRRLRLRVSAYTGVWSQYERPNAIWCTDFKGGFTLGDGR